MTSLTLYHVCLPDTIHLGYDAYDSMVVAAPSPDEARKIHPGGGSVTQLDSRPPLTISSDSIRGWIGLDRINELVVTELGPALPTVEAGVIVASFNAG